MSWLKRLLGLLGGGKAKAEGNRASSQVSGMRSAPVAPAAATPVAGQPWTVPGLGLEMVWVAPGTFEMGSTDGDDDSEPVHEVRLTHGYWMGKFEVMQAEYEAVMGANPSYFKGARRPVENVSWDDAVAFCRKLMEREQTAGRLPVGATYRLPTEAEWEYAARGGGAEPRVYVQRVGRTTRGGMV